MVYAKKSSIQKQYILSRELMTNQQGLIVRRSATSSYLTAVNQPWIRYIKVYTQNGSRQGHLTPDQEVAGSNPDGGLNLKVSESALSTASWAGKVIVTSVHLPRGM